MHRQQKLYVQVEGFCNVGTGSVASTAGAWPGTARPVEMNTPFETSSSIRRQYGFLFCHKHNFGPMSLSL